MKKLIYLAGFIAVATATSVYAEEVNFRVVNPVLQSLVDATIAGDDTIDFAYPRFDEKFSNLKKERLKYDLQGSMKSTPWLDGGKCDVVASSTYAADRSPDHTGIAVTMAATARTDVMALIRYSGYLSLRKVQGVSPKFATRVNAHLEHLSVATSLDDVYTLLISGQLLAKDITQDKIESETEYLHCLESGQCHTSNPEEQSHLINDAKSSIEGWRTYLKGFDQIQFETKKDQAGHITVLTVSSTQMSLFFERLKTYAYGKITTSSSKITLTPLALTATSDAFAKERPADLDAIKSDYQTALVGAQNGDIDQKDRIQKSFRDALIRFKQVIRGESIH